MKNIYMIGIKGVGMTSLALVYHQMGYTVSGSDVAKEFITDTILHKYGIEVHEGFNADNIPSHADAIVISGAHANEKNPEFVAVTGSSIPCYTHAEALGSLMEEFSLKMSICGSHGKTTTSAMLAFILAETPMKGAHCVGVPTFSGLDGGGYRGKEYFVAEADEYANKPHIDMTPRFCFQYPNILLCTNVDFDHPDIYSSLEAVQQAFKRFMQQTIEEKGSIIYCADDPHTSAVVKDLAYDALYSYGTSSIADLVISDIKDNPAETSFRATYRSEDLGIFTLVVSGLHNIKNAAAAVLACKLAGVDTVLVHKALAAFAGSQRRFETIYNLNNTFLLDDYAHHPQEIEAVVDAARHKFPNQRIVLIFQPHTYSRTHALGDEFKKALQKADMAYILNTFASERENSDNPQSDTNALGASYSDKDLLNELSQKLLKNDVIITMGAGDVYTLHPEIKKIIDQKAA